MEQGELIASALIFIYLLFVISRICLAGCFAAVLARTVGAVRGDN